MFYKVLTPLHYKERKYLAGEIVELPDEFLSLDTLLERGVIKATKAPEVKASEPVPVTTKPKSVTPAVPTPKKDDSSPTA